MGDICSLATFQFFEDHIREDIQTETTTLQRWVDNSSSHSSEYETQRRLVDAMCRVKKILLRCNACINVLVVANDAELRRKSNVDDYSGIGPKFPVTIRYAKGVEDRQHQFVLAIAPGTAIAIGLAKDKPSLLSAINVLAESLLPKLSQPLDKIAREGNGPDDLFVNRFQADCYNESQFGNTRECMQSLEEQSQKYALGTECGIQNIFPQPVSERLFQLVLCQVLFLGFRVL